MIVACVGSWVTHRKVGSRCSRVRLVSSLTVDSVHRSVEEIYQTESRRVLATLIRLVGDFDTAEEALNEAFAAAVEQWPREGIPANPRAWLVSTGRFRAIDAIRRNARHHASQLEIARRLDETARVNESRQEDEWEDDRLRLIFTCCHPALAPQTQVALTLREICDLTTDEIASAFLTAPATIAQRIVRGKAKIRDAGIPYQIPELSELPARLESVLAVIYLVFNEGYSATSGDSLTRADLSDEAIRIGRLLVELLPEAEPMGLLALMLFQDSRRLTRSTPEGELVLLEDQDRTRWNTVAIAEAVKLVSRALATGKAGIYTIQAAMASIHATARTSAETNWTQMVVWYDILLQVAPSPVVELNRAVAVAMRDGPQAGLDLIEAIFDQEELLEYHLAHAARADLYRRLGNRVAARTSYQRALELAKQEPQRRFLEKRLRELL